MSIGAWMGSRSCLEEMSLGSGRKWKSGREVVVDLHGRARRGNIGIMNDERSKQVKLIDYVISQGRSRAAQSCSCVCSGQVIAASRQ